MVTEAFGGEALPLLFYWFFDSFSIGFSVLGLLKAKATKIFGADNYLDCKPDIYRSQCWPLAPVGDHFLLRIIQPYGLDCVAGPF
jgi:hypothetical protein